MTRIVILGALATLLGVALGFGGTWYEFSKTEERMTVHSGGGGSPAPETQAVVSPRVQGTGRAVVVGSEKHDFGLVEPGSTHQHTFVVKNEGEGTLEVKHYGVSCSLCVQTSFTSALVAPGESLEIPVTLQVQKQGPQLTEAFEVTTNDPQHEHLSFQLLAYVTRAFRSSVDTLAAGTIPTDQDSSASLRVYSYYTDTFEISGLRLEPGKKDLIELETRPLEPQDFQKEEPRALAAQEVLVRFKPGLPVGPLRQSIRFEAKNGNAALPFAVDLEAKVAGDVALLGGSGWSGEHNLLTLGRVPRGSSRQAKLTILVRGEHRDDVQLSVGSIDPEGTLHAEIGERKTLNEVHMYPLTISLDPNAPPVNRLGTLEMKPGSIVIQTTHPTAKELILFVRFAVD